MHNALLRLNPMRPTPESHVIAWANVRRGDYGLRTDHLTHTPKCSPNPPITHLRALPHSSIARIRNNTDLNGLGGPSPLIAMMHAPAHRSARMKCTASCVGADVAREAKKGTSRFNRGNLHMRMLTRVVGRVNRQCSRSWHRSNAERGNADCCRSVIRLKKGHSWHGFLTRVRLGRKTTG